MLVRRLEDLRLGMTVLVLCSWEPTWLKVDVGGTLMVSLSEDEVKEEETEGRLAFSETGGLSGPYPSPKKHNLFSVRNNSWKLIYQKTVDEYELYDLIHDPEENKNLFGTNQEIEHYLKNLIIKQLPSAFGI